MHSKPLWNYLGRWWLVIALMLSACLEPAKDPRPLPKPKLDGSLFDARTPRHHPNSGSGYGSGVPGPSGPSGSGSHSDAAVGGLDEGAPDQGAPDAGPDTGADGTP